MKNPSTAGVRPQPVSDSDRVMEIVRGLALELHPQRKQIEDAGLDSNLDKDLGFDSLGRVEMFLRLERIFKVDIPEDLLAEVETPRDLLNAIGKAGRRSPRARTARPREPIAPKVQAAPAEATTLVEALEWHIHEHPDRPHILLPSVVSGEQQITYGLLAQNARAVAFGLRTKGVEPRDRVAIMLPTGSEFFSAFFGVLFAGAVPVPIYPPTRLSQIEDHLRRQAAILDNAGVAVLITVKEALRFAMLLKSHIAGLRLLETVEALSQDGARETAPKSASDDPALLQYTSGSTGNPKGVVLTHANLLANIRAMGQVLEADSSDVFVSWLPLYHDMGLIGAWLGSLYFAAPVAVMSPLAFLARPDRWLWAIHRYRASLSAAPNFAFELCLNKIDDEDIEGLDLSSLRMLANGAEPVRPQTIRRFTERFANYGFRPEAMAPMYGLAENSVGLALPPLGRVPIIDCVHRERFESRGEAMPAKPNDARTLEFVACGRPLPGHQIRIIDGTGYEVGERRLGRLQFQGPSATKGYFRNPAQTKTLFDGEWLDTGDLAYMADGDVYIAGRSKDVILRGGRNIYPEEVEEAVGDIAGVRKGCVALFGSVDPSLQTERLILVAETRATDKAKRTEILRETEKAVLSFLDLPPDEIVLAPPHTVPKTSSGKLRRSAAKDLYERGRIAKGSQAVWWQLVRLTAGSFRPRMRKAFQTLTEYLFAGYWLSVYRLLALLTWPLVVLLPRRAWRWKVLHFTARLGLWLMGVPLSVKGFDHLPPESGMVIVANHSSHLDGLVLAAALPGELAFVAKEELAHGPISGPFLKRLGTVFVERLEPEAALESAEEALSFAQSGERLVFFPEGTFTRMPGLLDFHLGAFIIAASANLSIVPVAIRGTRSILRGDDWFPRSGSVSVELGPPLRAEGNDFAAAVRLRDAARREILARVHEPDLAHEQVMPPS